ncbi:MAG TPA: Xaa-Pro peptidase family protein [Longimicrobiales bacterium]
MSVTMEDTAPAFERLRAELDEIQAALREAGLDGWLLFDVYARNKVAMGMLGFGEQKRRYFAWIPATGEPVAVMHGIEEGPWARWPWARRRYVSWRELDDVLRELLGGARRIAMELSPGDAVPALDLVPAGVVELVRKAGPEVVSSGDLITRFYSSWTPAQLASHRRAAETLAQVARDAFAHLAGRVAAGEPVTEAEMRRWVVGALEERGAGAGADAIVATGVSAADPHYHPVEGGATFQRGDVVLIDLWAKESEDSVYADQTWMGYLGSETPAKVAEVFGAVRDARDAAIAFLRERWAAGERIQGYEVDDVTRAVIERHGYGKWFIHRTGHSIDRSTHGMGPNMDNLETHEVRSLIPGVGFSIEPGIYLPGELGVRTEINVYIGADGPEVTPSGIQHEVFTLLDD